jgi:hypothetical protein
LIQKELIQADNLPKMWSNRETIVESDELKILFLCSFWWECSFSLNAVDSKTINTWWISFCDISVIDTHKSWEKVYYKCENMRIK